MLSKTSESGQSSSGTHKWIFNSDLVEIFNKAQDSEKKNVFKPNEVEYFANAISN